MIEVLEFYFSGLLLSSVRNQRRNLSLVCQLWRQIVHSTPSMWHRMHLNDSIFTRIRDDHLECALGMWMRKAGTLPLELEAHFARWGPDGSRIVARVLRGSASQWKSITLDGFWTLEFAVDTREWGRKPREHPSIHWDRLETVQVINPVNDTRAITQPIPRPYMPRLRSLALISGSHHFAHYSFIFPFKQLHYINLSEVWVGSIGPTLQHCEQLKEFTILSPTSYWYGSHNAGVSISSLPVPLTRLRRWRIEGSLGAQMLSSPLDPILFPNLDELSVWFGRAECQPLDSPSLKVLRQKLTQSQCSNLTKMALCNPGGSLESLHSLLTATPALEHLDLALSLADLDFLAKCNKQKALLALETFRLETLAYLWPKSSRVGANQKDKLNGRDMVHQGAGIYASVRRSVLFIQLERSTDPGRVYYFIV
ncbi:hypothetical protein BKA70DRAFT_1409018 [Coprinopsis sp. MPI-PUGE-AT-0042]|nr:hypothetical protein BKA70DRAFT_1409018 [Coprinopsis sp. MPI-PUGE-AT-0042]